MRKNSVLFVGLAVFCLVSTCAAKDNEVPQPVERAHWIYYFDDPTFVKVADKVLDTVRPQLIRLLGDSLSYRPSIYIVNSNARFQQLVQTKFPDWGAGAAIPLHKMIVIKSPHLFNINKPIEELLAHEYAHLALHERTGFHEPPRWFDEGLAMYVSTEWSWSDYLALSKASIFGQILPLDSIEYLNRFNESQAHVAYAESYLATRYFYEEYTAKSVQVFLDSIRAGESVSDALVASTGSNYREFDREVRLYIQKHYNISTLFMDTMFLWAGLALIVLIGVYVSFKKRRQYYKKWEREERLQSSDFDYGDPDNPEHVDDEDEPWRN